MKRFARFGLMIGLSMCLLFAGGTISPLQATNQQEGETMTKQSPYQKPSDQELRERLSELQYRVTQQSGTEPPFQNEYWDFDEPGIYVDIVTGEPLFTSLDKYQSSCGWPAFMKGIEDERIVEKEDLSIGRVRTEVRSRLGDSHLGHVFQNDPESPNGVRYCINSASLRFVPLAQLEQEGYGELLPLFEKEQKK